jgi:hypothetical protein
VGRGKEAGVKNKKELDGKELRRRLTGRDLENTCQAAVRPREGLRLMDEC